jgi:hypothetical protein
VAFGATVHSMWSVGACGHHANRIRNRLERVHVSLHAPQQRKLWLVHRGIEPAQDENRRTQFSRGPAIAIGWAVPVDADLMGTKAQIMHRNFRIASQIRDVG